MATSVAAQAAPLPPRLMNFFAKYPPKLYSAHFTRQTIPTVRQKIEKHGDKRLGTPAQATVEEVAQPSPWIESISNIEPSATEPMSTPLPTSIPDPGIDASSKLPPNPFLPYRNPATGRWRGARIGLRVQADLVKIAKRHGVEALLPASRKSTEFKQQRALDRGLAVKGTGEGQKVKGHKWERTMDARLEERRKAMEGMPALIREWQQRGHGRGWKKFPK